MRAKSAILIILAVGCGLVAAIGISQVMDARSNGPADGGDKTPVFVALLDISPNEKLTPQNIKLEEWPKNLVPAGTLTKLEDIEGRKSKIKLYAGETILASKLLAPGEVTGAANQIPIGYRVAHVKIDSISGSSNLIQPGDRVDVLLFRNTNNDMAAAAGRMVLQDVRVFAVDTTTENDSRKNTEHGEPISAKTIQLLVTPEQSLLLHMASEVNGSALRLVLRNPDDDTHVSSATATLGDIFGPELKSNRKDEQLSSGERKTGLGDFLEDQVKESPIRPVAAPIVPSGPRRSMILIQGNQVSTVDFPDSGQPPQTPAPPYEDESANTPPYTPDNDSSNN